MAADVLQTLASFLGALVAAQAMFLFFGALFGVHAALLVWSLRIGSPAQWGSGRARGAVLFFELLYGFANPLFYLVVIERFAAAPLAATPFWMTSTAWTLLVLLWTARLVGRHPALDGERGRRAIQALLGCSLLAVLAFLVKNLADVLARPEELGLAATTPSYMPFAALFVLGFLSLYLVPASLLGAHLQATTSPNSWAAERRLLLGRRRGARVLGVVLIVVATPAALASVRWRGEAAVRELVLAHRDAIVAAARQQGIDPRLLASLLYVVQRGAVSPLTLRLEELAMRAWSGEPPVPFPVGSAVDVSIGLMQVKPGTALAASEIHATALSNREGDGVERTGWLGWTTWALPRSAVAGLAPPLALDAHATVVPHLLDDAGSLATAAFILALLEAQWRSANPAWDLASRPAIAATLYQLGFARSRPHATPRANEFGDAVGREYASPWMTAHFGSTALPPAPPPAT